MAYDFNTINSHVRALIPNLKASDYSDSNMQIVVDLALRRLNRDHPASDSTFILTGDGGRYYDLSSVAPDGIGSLWNSRTVIKRIYRPTTDQVSKNRDIAPLQLKEWAVVPTSDDVTSLYFVEALGRTETATIVYNAPATTANLPDDMQSALEFLVASFVCYAMSAKAAGITDSDLPADIVSYRSKQMEYRRAGQAFEEQYAKEVGLNQPVVAAAMKGDYDPRLQSDLPYTTHNPFTR